MLVARCPTARHARLGDASCPELDLSDHCLRVRLLSEGDAVSFMVGDSCLGTADRLVIPR